MYDLLLTQKLVDFYLDDCRGRSLRPATIAIYRIRLQALVEYAPSVNDINHFVATRYFNDMMDRGAKSISIHQAYRTLRTFARWLFEQELVEANPLAKLKPPKVDRPQKIAPTDTAIKKLIDACNGDELGARDKCIVLLLVDSGMRVGELANLKRDDLDGENILLTETKGRRDRFAFVSSTTRLALLKYLATRTDDNPALFVSRLGEAVTRNTVQKMMLRRSREAKVGVSPHMLRRAAATAWTENGANLEVVRQLLGHADLQTTQKYIGIRPEMLKDAHRQVSYVNGMNHTAKGQSISR